MTKFTYKKSTFMMDVKKADGEKDFQKTDCYDITGTPFDDLGLVVHKTSFKGHTTSTTFFKVSIKSIGLALKSYGVHTYGDCKTRDGSVYDAIEHIEKVGVETVRKRIKKLEKEASPDVIEPGDPWFQKRRDENAKKESEQHESVYENG